MEKNNIFWISLLLISVLFLEYDVKQNSTRLTKLNSDISDLQAQVADLNEHLSNIDGNSSN